MSEGENQRNDNGISRAAMTPEAPVAQITVEELVQATVRAMLLSNQEALANPSIKNSEIAALLPEFCGNQDVDLWLERVELVQSVYKVSNQIMQLVAVGKLADTAKKWYLSKVEYVSMDWDTLKAEMKKYFSSRPDRVVLRRKFESRRWKRGEKFSNYFHEKVLLGNNAGIDESEMVDYLIDGFDDIGMQNQARMQNFESLEKLLAVMKNVADRNVNTMTSSNRHPRGVSAVGSASSSSGKVIKCFNCNREGHLANKCEKPKRPPGSCFECGSLQHLVKSCPKRTSRSASTTVPDSTSSSNVIDLKSPYMCNVEYRVDDPTGIIREYNYGNC